MSLQLILGSALSRKTEDIYDRIIDMAEKNPQNNYVMVVPEQASLTVQEDLVNRHPRRAISNIDVLTFNRLAFRVFEDNGEPKYDALDELGKMMLLRLVTLECAKGLKVLGRSINRIGILAELKSVISELVQYNVTPEKLKAYGETLTDRKALQAKVTDIAVVYEAFMKRLHKKQELAEERVTRLADTIGKWEKLSHTVFAFDGFTGFTPPQYAVLSEIIKKSPLVIAGVTIGQGEAPENHKTPDDLFYMSVHMAAKLKELAIGHMVDIEEIPSEELSANPEFRHLERSVYRFPQQVFDGETDRIRFVKARNSREEIENVLHEILKDVRAGYRYRDIAVITGDLEGDREEIESRFAAAQVPFFIDSRKNVSNNVLCVFIKDALEVLDKRFNYASVFSFLKNPLVAVLLQTADHLTPFEQLCEVENVALALGVRGQSGFEKEWNVKGHGFRETRMPAINQTKNTIMKGLFAFSNRMKETKTAAEKVGAIKALMTDYKVAETMKQLAKKYAEDPQLTEAQIKLFESEYQSLPLYIEDFLDRFAELFAETDLTFDAFADVLQVGIQGVVMKHVPPTKDRVVIGNLTRTRLGDIKKLYVLRANEGILPENHSGAGLLSDHDREILKQGNITLAETAAERAFFDRYYIYLLLTKATEGLTVSYITVDSEGKGTLPSEIVGSLRKMFPKAPLYAPADNLFARLNMEADGVSILAEELAALRETGETPSEKARGLYQWFHGDGKPDERLFPVLAGFDFRHVDAKLSDELSRKLYSNKLTGSVTLLEKYARCPYSHFLQYGLGLKERELYKVEVMDVGSMLHDSIDAFFRNAAASGRKWHELPEEEEKALLKQCISDVVENARNDIMNSSARNAYIKTRIERLCARTLWALKRQWNAGAFSRTKTEVGFGAGEELPPITVPLSDGGELVLRGRIDRMDMAESDGRIAVKIIDYKSSARSVDFKKVMNGTQLQLLLYLKAATDAEQEANPEASVVPAGVYYYGMTDPVVARSGKEPPEESIYRNLKLQGLTNGDVSVLELIDRDWKKSDVIKGVKATKENDGVKNPPAGTITGEAMETLERFAMKKATELGNKILSGEIPVSPIADGRNSSCTYCPYSSVCGFDTRIEGFKPRYPKKATIETIIGEMKENEEETEESK